MFGNKPKKIKAKKILFMAAVGSHNLGDELIIKGEVDFIQKHYGANIEITVCTYDRTSTLITDPNVQYASYFPNDIRHHFFRNIGYFFNNIWLIAHADVLIIGGGGILFDNEPGVSFWWLYQQWSLRVRIARLCKTTLLFWGIGLEITEVYNKMKLRKLFVPGDFILVRDERSNGLLTALEIPSVQVQDIVFLHTPPLSLESNITTKRVGISVRGGFLEENEGAIAMIYDRLIELGYTPIFLVFSTAGTENQNDTLFIQKLMIGKTYNTTKTIEQTLEIYPSLYAVIGMRLHAGILACVQEIPYIPISYGPKTDELIDMLEYDHLAITAKDLTLELFESRWQALMADYDRERTRMRESHVFFRDTLTKKLDSI